MGSAREAHQLPESLEDTRLSRRGVLALHVGFWMMYVAIVVAFVTVLRLRVGDWSAGPGLSYALAAVLIVPAIVAFYPAYAIVFRLVSERRITAVAVWGAAICGAAAIVGFWLLYMSAGSPPLPLSHWPEFAGLLLCFFLLGALHSAMAVGMRGFLAWYADLRGRAERARRAQTLELDLIRSRLDPHFLFNTVNNIDVLIEQDPALASAYLHRLSALIRYVLFDAAARRVPLTVELAHLTDYLELEALRHAQPRYATLDLTGDASHATVPPTLFMPFVENAFKHGARGGQEGTVRIRCDVLPDHVTFRCINRYWHDASAPVARTDQRNRLGLGQALVRRRLDLVYPGRHALEIRRFNDEYDVTLTIPAHDDSLPDR